jgi:hypothetical protein
MSSLGAKCYGSTPVSKTVRPGSIPGASASAADEFGLDLYANRIDPSDPEACFNFLFDLYPERWREVLANWEGASYLAGQMYIDAEMRRVG